MYLLISHGNGYIEEKGVNKYLVFDSTDENKELLKKYNDVFNGIRDKIKEINISDCDYEKDCKLLKKIVNFIYKVFLDDALYELNI